MATKKLPRTHRSTHTRSTDISHAQREAVALAHGLAEVRAVLAVYCKHLPQQPRLTRICEHAIDRLCPRDPVGDFEGGEG